MILVNVKSYDEMVVVANYINPEHIPEHWKFVDYDTRTVMILENEDWGYASLPWIKKEPRYKDNPILTFNEFKLQYLDNPTETTDDIHKPSHYQL